MINVTASQAVVSGLIAVALFTAGVAAWLYLEKIWDRGAHRHEHRQFEQDMAAVELPAWTPESLAFLADPYAYERRPAWDGSSYAWTPPQPGPELTALPASSSQAASADTAAYIATMNQRVAANIAAWSRQTDQYVAGCA